MRAGRGVGSLLLDEIVMTTSAQHTAFPRIVELFLRERAASVLPPRDLDGLSGYHRDLVKEVIRLHGSESTSTSQRTAWHVARIWDPAHAGHSGEALRALPAAEQGGACGSNSEPSLGCSLAGCRRWTALINAMTVRSEGSPSGEAPCGLSDLAPKSHRLE